ncbi:MAG: CHASE3 domain-containing protein [Sphingomonas sp.]
MPLILVLLAIIINRGFDETASLRREVVRSYETRAELQRLLSLHQDIETGQRGFVITGDERFLDPYKAAIERVGPTLTALEGDLREASVRGGDLVALRVASAQMRGFADRTIALTRSGARADAQRLVARGEGRTRMDRLRALIGQLSDEERAELRRRTDAAETTQIKLRRRSIVLETFLLLMLALAAMFIARINAVRELVLRRHTDLATRQEMIFESAKDGMIVLNPSGGIESLNPAAAKMFAYPAEELLRRDVNMLFEVAPERAQVETFLRRLKARRLEVSGEVQEFIGRRRDGTSFPLEVSISPFQLKAVTQFLAVTRDISERRGIEQMKDEFVATVSHELRTPLTSIAGSLGLIMGGAAGELPRKALRLVEIAQANSSRLVRLINDILDMEKIEAGQIELDIRPIHLATILTAALHANAGFAAEYGVHVELEPPPEGAAVLADDDRLMQVLTNLLSNAIKFSPRGEAVSVSVTQLERRFRISVADKGAGIADAFRSRIFTKFAQADSSDTRQKGGTGLGLSIVREIVEQLGGLVGFESSPGEGTVFHVDLPAATMPGARGAEIAAPDRPADELPRILHVDDDPDMLRVLASVFDSWAVVYSTPSVQEARSALRFNQFDAAILDIGMEDGSGLDLVPELRLRRIDVPIFVFTAQEVEPNQLKGVDRALVKSRASLDQLAAEVMEVIARRQRERGQQEKTQQEKTG